MISGIPGMDPAELIARAESVRARSYSPYSKFSVGAAIEGEDGSVFVGCNVESASFGLTCCAERTALFSAVSAGVRRFAKLAVVSPNGAAPCGACRQVLREFCEELEIHLADAGGKARSVTLSQLLPESFGPEDLIG